MKVKKVVVDERVLHMENRIMAELGHALLSGLGLSLLVKSALLHQPFASYGFELLALVLSLLYLIVRFCWQGLDMERGSNLWLSCLGVSILVTILGSWNNYMTYGSHYQSWYDWHFLAMGFIFFLSSFFLTALTMGAIHFVNQKRQKKVMEILEEEENS